MKAETISKWLLVVFGVLWLGAGTWYEILRYDKEFEVREQLRQERSQRKIDDCRGSFSRRYECKNAAKRENQVATFKIWARKFSVICVPPIVMFLGYIGVMVIVERRREAARVTRRRKRKYSG